MRKINRRNFLKATGVLAAASALAACGGSSTSTAGSTGSTAGSAAGADGAKAYNELTVGTDNTDLKAELKFISHRTDLIDDGTFDGYVAAFQKLYPNITIKYEGITDCLGAIRIANVFKDCACACLGLGTCEKACPFDAIHVVNGVAKVDEDKCAACSKCVSACPKHIISLVPQANPIRIDCSSKAKGKEVMDSCKVGCIGCGLCAKTCKFGAITMEGNLPVIDYTKCKKCQLCAKACPRHIIEPWNTPEKVKELAEIKAKQAAAKKAAAEKAAAAKKAAEEAAKAEEK